MCVIKVLQKRLKILEFLLTKVPTQDPTTPDRATMRKTSQLPDIVQETETVALGF